MGNASKIRYSLLLLLLCFAHYRVIAQNTNLNVQTITLQKPMCLECDPQQYGYDFEFLRVKTGNRAVDSCIWMAQMPQGFQAYWYLPDMPADSLRKYLDSCSYGLFSSQKIQSVLRCGSLLQLICDAEWTGAYITMEQLQYIFDLNSGKRLDYRDLLDAAFESMLLDSIMILNEAHFTENRQLFLEFTDNIENSQYYMRDTLTHLTVYDSAQEKADFFELNCNQKISYYSIFFSGDGNWHYSNWNSGSPAHRHMHAIYDFTFVQPLIKQHLVEPYRSNWYNNKIMTLK